MSLDIVCLKVGEAYGPEYVNEMFKRVDDLMPVGDFICYTDNPLDLNGNITVRGITPLYNDRMWWNKVMLLNPAHENNALYLDLDTYMHKGIHGLNLKGQILKTAWFSNDMAMKIHYCNINSSVMRLFDNNFEKQYRDWYDNKEKLYKSFYGLDSWFYRRHNLDFFDPGVAYSYKFGSQFPNDVEQNKLRRDHAICVFDDCENRYDILKELWNGSS